MKFNGAGISGRYHNSGAGQVTVHWCGSAAGMARRFGAVVVSCATARQNNWGRGNDRQGEADRKPKKRQRVNRGAAGTG